MKNIWKLYMMVSLLVALASCTAEEDFDLPSGADGRVLVEANVLASLDTRSGGERPYVPEGALQEGTYFLHYHIPSSSSYYKYAMVDFGDTEGATTGYCYFMDGDKVRDLMWRSVYEEGEKSSTFYLTNVDPNLYTISGSYGSTTYWNHFRFNKTGVTNPYNAGPLDTEHGTNDILSGSASATNQTGKINFTMYHRLSLLRINIEVYGAKSDNHLIDLSNAEVYISNMATVLGAFQINSPTTFAYNTSTTTYKNGGTYRTNSNTLKRFDLVAPQSSSLYWENTEEGEVGGDYDDWTKKTYTTRDFVFPPQTVPYTTSASRPVLTVRVPKSDVTGSDQATGYVEYSAKIPDIMFNADDDGNIQESNPETLALKTGTRLTLTATINSPETDLHFAPAKVERWISIKSVTISTKQSGIYNETDFDNLVKAYAAGEYWKLGEYGYVDENGDFIFQFWSNVDLKESDIKGRMKTTDRDAPNFAFLFNGYSVTLTDRNDAATGEPEILSDTAGQWELYDIVTDSSSSFKGIKSREDMEDFCRMLSAASDRMPFGILKYAELNNAENTMKFEIAGSFNISAEDIIWKLPKTIWGYTPTYTFKEGIEIGVEFPGQSQPFVYKEGQSFNPVKKLFDQNQTVGVNSEDEFYMMTCCYNIFKDYPDALRPFGTVNTSTGLWTLTLRSSLTLEGPRTFMSMRPDVENGRPNYSISMSSSYKFTVEDDMVPASTTNNTHVQKMLSGTGAATAYSLGGTGTSLSTTSTSYIISCYNNPAFLKTNYAWLWAYGRFENGKWIFPLKASGQYLESYAVFYGKMKPDIEAGKYDYEFELGDYVYTIRRFPLKKGGSGSTGTAYYRYFTQENTDNYNGTAITYPNSAEALKAVGLGTYWDLVDEWENK